MYLKVRSFKNVLQSQFILFYELKELADFRYKFLLYNCYDYKSFRLSNFLPVRGQRTQTNANTQKRKNFSRPNNAKKKYQRKRKGLKVDLKKRLIFCLF